MDHVYGLQVVVYGCLIKLGKNRWTSIFDESVSDHSVSDYSVSDHSVSDQSQK